MFSFLEYYCPILTNISRIENEKSFFFLPDNCCLFEFTWLIRVFVYVVKYNYLRSCIRPGLIANLHAVSCRSYRSFYVYKLIIWINIANPINQLYYNLIGCAFFRSIRFDTIQNLTGFMLFMLLASVYDQILILIGQSRKSLRSTQHD